MRLLSRFVQQSGRCLLVIPGPSSIEVGSLLGFGHVATVNRGALLVRGPIDFAFCNDLEALEQIRAAWDRIRTFVIPDRLGIGSRVSTRSWAEFEGVPIDRTLIFPHEPLTETESKIAGVVDDPDRIVTFNSAGAGLHALARLGYRKVQVIGCDGGTGYSPLLHYGGYGSDFSVIRDRMHYLAGLLDQTHGCEVRFSPERFQGDSP